MANHVCPACGKHFNNAGWPEDICQDCWADWCRVPSDDIEATLVLWERWLAGKQAARG